MSFLSDIQNLDRNNVGGWPQSVKIFFTALLCAVVLLVGWYFFVSDQQDSLNTLVSKEGQLKQEFATKQAKSVNLEALEQQLNEMQDMLRDLLLRRAGQMTVERAQDEPAIERQRLTLQMRGIEPAGQAQILKTLQRPKLRLGRGSLRRSIRHQAHRPHDVFSNDHQLQAVTAIHKEEILRTFGEFQQNRRRNNLPQ